MKLSGHVCLLLLMKKILILIITLFIVAFISAVLWAYFVFIHTKSLSQSELAELTPEWRLITHNNWSPWFDAPDGTKEWNPAASFNAWLASVPEQEKAWPVLVDEYYRNQSLFDNREALRPVADIKDWESMSVLLATDQNRETIQKIVDAIERPVMGCGIYKTTDPYEHQAMIANGVEDENWLENPELNPGLMTLFPPAPRLQHKVSRLVLLSAGELLNQGQTDEFVNRISIVLKSSQLSSEYPTLINQLGTLSTLSSSLMTISWALEHHSEKINEAHLVALDSAIEQVQTIEFLWEGEAITFHDTLRRLASPKGELSLQSASSWGGGNGALDDPISLPDLELHKSVQRMLYVYGELLEESARQSNISWNGSRVGINQLFEKSKKDLGAPGAMLIDLMLPALDRTANIFRESAQQKIGVRTAIAIHRHKLQHGKFPDSVDEVDPDFIVFQPIDMFTGNRLHYALRNSDPLIYSVGPDMDNDDGLHVFGIARESSKIDGDWVLYPVPQISEDE